ncbi:unnamed protein product [Protopolystoma xenopodis]|uniref:Uncharacterized protein n=1 Tax=Protopolystoma xenopodis TaxID=117903 RepID=A0A3S5BVG9_9PLAT|nr:unnamed protein product [Protopolystoma xenopodis]
MAPTPSRSPGLHETVSSSAIVSTKKSSSPADPGTGKMHVFQLSEITLNGYYLVQQSLTQTHEDESIAVPVGMKPGTAQEFTASNMEWRLKKKSPSGLNCRRWPANLEAGPATRPPCRPPPITGAGSDWPAWVLCEQEGEVNRLLSAIREENACLPNNCGVKVASDWSPNSPSTRLTEELFQSFEEDVLEVDTVSLEPCDPIRRRDKMATAEQHQATSAFHVGFRQIVQRMRLLGLRVKKNWKIHADAVSEAISFDSGEHVLSFHHMTDIIRAR